MTLVKKWINFSLLIIASLFGPSAHAQSDLYTYLAAHHFAFSLDSGFDAQTQDTLREKLKPYRLVLAAEGGSHYLGFYTRLPTVWLRFLHQYFHTRHFFLESGYSLQVCTQVFLTTGDTAYISLRNKRFWNDWRNDNLTRADTDRVVAWGIDFERSPQYIRALQYIFPHQDAPTTIADMVGMVKGEPDTLKDCKIVKTLTKSLLSSLQKNEDAWKQYLGVAAFRDFEQVLKERWPP